MAATIAPSEGAPSVVSRHENIDKPEVDKKLYRYLELSNGMRVLLVHDPEMEVGSHYASNAEDGDAEAGDEGDGKAEVHQKLAAAAALVGVGWFSDPLDMPGLSHYLEHMLFMGSAKYPDEAEYSDFVQRHGGHTNAYTCGDHTCYYFDIQPSKFREALDRFAQFFTHPLLREDCLEREVTAVDNEFAGRVSVNPIRWLHVCEATARPEHPAHHFGCGNKATLWDEPRAAGTDVRARITEHYRTLYGARKMCLAVYGKETLQELEAQVLELFGTVAPGSGPRLAYPEFGDPFAGQGQRIYAYSLVGKGHRVLLTFPWPPLEDKYKHKAERYVEHVLGHGGPGSLLSALKARSLATSLSTYTSMHSYGSHFVVQLDLTDAAFAARKWTDAVELVFAAAASARAAGPQERLWQELRALARLKFLYKEGPARPSSFAVNTVANLPFVDPQHAISGDYVYDEYAPAAIAALLDRVRPGVDGMRVDVMTESLAAFLAEAEEAASAGPDKYGLGFAGGWTADREKHIGIDFYVKTIPEAVIGSWKEAPEAEDLFMPRANPYIPADFTVFPEEPVDAPPVPLVAAPRAFPAMLCRAPDLLVDIPGLRLWHKACPAYGTARASISACLCPAGAAHEPGSPEDAQHSAAAVILNVLASDLSLEMQSQAQDAGMSFAFNLDPGNGWLLQAAGFSHHLVAFARSVAGVLGGMASHVTPEVYARIKDLVLRWIANRELQPARQASYALTHATLVHNVPSKRLAEATRDMTMEDALSQLRGVLRGFHLEVLACGNLTRQDAIDTAAAIASALNPAAPAALQWPAGLAPRPDACGDTGGVLRGDGGEFAALDGADRPRKEFLQMPVGDRAIDIPSTNPDEPQSALFVLYDFGVLADEGGATDTTVLLADLVEQMTNTQMFDRLRTKEELCYAVGVSATFNCGRVTLRAYVTSGVKGPQFLQERLDAFVESHYQTLCDMKDDEFQHHKDAVRAERMRAATSVVQEANRHWDEIQERGYIFHYRELDAAALERVTKGDVCAFYQKHLLSGQRRRLAIRVHGKSSDEPGRARSGEDESAGSHEQRMGIRAADVDAALAALDALRAKAEVVRARVGNHKVVAAPGAAK
ncbi:unnamed protein product [Pedinophyceae sp. YPF-701]|nr:unnamed protein product [Pedinophyceae sp. YPF-701]